MSHIYVSIKRISRKQLAKKIKRSPTNQPKSTVRLKVKMLIYGQMIFWKCLNRPRVANETAQHITGRRIVDIGYILSSLKSIKHEGFECAFFDINIIREKRFGLKNVFSQKNEYVKNCQR